MIKAIWNLNQPKLMKMITLALYCNSKNNYDGSNSDTNTPNITSKINSKRLLKSSKIMEYLKKKKKKKKKKKEYICSE